MTTETNQEVEVETSTETPTETEEATVSMTQVELDKLNSTIGSLKRENKDLKKETSTPKETKTEKTDDNSQLELLQKTYLRAADIVDEDEVEMALETAKKWGVEIDKLVDDEDFKVRLERIRTQKSNETATSKVKGGAGKGGANQSPDYWVAKGVPPTREQVPSRKDRVAITKAMIAKENNTGAFYND